MRTIDSIIIHCSATPNGRPLSVDTIRSWHKDRGFEDIGYHYVILVDGSVANGRPVEQVGAHCLGWNARSIGICMVGGVAGPDAKNPGQYSPAQWSSLVRLIEDLRSKYSINIILGHRDTSPDKNKDGVVTSDEWIKLCPSFDVHEWLMNGMKPFEINVLKG